VRAATIHEQQRLKQLANVVVTRNYRRPLTLASVARALSTSPRQVQRAYSRDGTSFSEELAGVRMTVAAQLLVDQPAIPIADIGRLVGYSRATHFSRAFRRYHGMTPTVFRQRRRAARSPLSRTVV
jgi:two-component system, response regulator YesN